MVFCIITFWAFNALKLAHKISYVNPAIIFFPDGQNSGGIIKIEFENSIYIINIDKNGQITTSYENY